MHIYLNYPKNLKDLLTYRIESRISRSSNSKILRYHKSRMAIAIYMDIYRYGNRYFRQTSAELWNGIPRGLRLVTSIDRFKIE